MLLAQKKHHIHSLKQITPPFLDRCPVAVKPCLRLSPLAKGESYPSLGRHLMHTGYRSIQSGKIDHRDFFSNLAKLHTTFLGGGGGALENHTSKRNFLNVLNIMTVQTANSQRSKINRQHCVCVCVCVCTCVCVCACTVFSSRVFCPFYQCEHPLSTCVHSIDNNIFSAFEYAYICVFLVACAGSLCLCAFLCVGMSFAHLFSILVERLLSIVSEMV